MLGAWVLGAVLLLAPAPARAYSVLAHEALVDAQWESGVRPLLLKRFPRATKQALDEARAYAYGGSVIQDLGYYPFGSRFFSDLLHYVRSGDFVESLVRESADLNEYAFALGAMAHYAADNVGHPEGVNRSVPLMFPKLQAKYGDSVTYADSRSSHVITEFSFDIVQAAAGAFLPETYHAFIGFQVAKPLLVRAFRATYGLEMHDLFGDEDGAIATYRHAVSELIPEFTRIAWRDKKEEIARLVPSVTESAFVYTYTRQQYEKEFGTGYRKPGWGARFLGVLYRIVPKIGPLKPLRFKTPTPEAQELFERSFKAVRARYAAALEAAGAGRLDLTNRDFDTGEPSAYGEYPLADKTYEKLLKTLDHQKFANVPPALRTNIAAFYGHTGVPKKIEERLAALNASRAQTAATTGAKQP